MVYHKAPSSAKNINAGEVPVWGGGEEKFQGRREDLRKTEGGEKDSVLLPPKGTKNRIEKGGTFKRRKNQNSTVSTYRIHPSGGQGNSPKTR